MNATLLTKIVCLGGFGSTAMGALIYHNFKGTHTLEYLQNQQIGEKNIENLNAENAKLNVQLGSATLPVSVTVECEANVRKYERID